LKILLEKIEDQGEDAKISQSISKSQSYTVTNVSIANPIIIENLSDIKIKNTDKSQTKNVIVNGNDNQVVTDSKNTTINSKKGGESKQHWLQILYWVIGILVAGITIYKFIIE